ncbi:hypothetical protein ADUPG1_007744 [Aduncisulcus paluster]|uniref:Uncharacterized protein n=1 Tax=Aduncisulcus paluster TaxID=2918883 RepID=A0ABQ5KPD3_9EUKA|nr:hypothetical protein ADUPG1_007744 [Aduncisulcus paluster]
MYLIPDKGSKKKKRIQSFRDLQKYFSAADKEEKFQMSIDLLPPSHTSIIWGMIDSCDEVRLLCTKVITDFVVILCELESEKDDSLKKLNEATPFILTQITQRFSADKAPRNFGSSDHLALATSLGFKDSTPVPSVHNPLERSDEVKEAIIYLLTIIVDCLTPSCLSIFSDEISNILICGTLDECPKIKQKSIELVRIWSDKLPEDAGLRSERLIGALLIGGINKGKLRIRCLAIQAAVSVVSGRGKNETVTRHLVERLIVLNRDPKIGVRLCLAEQIGTLLTKHVDRHTLGPVFTSCLLSLLSDPSEEVARVALNSLEQGGEQLLQDDKKRYKQLINFQDSLSAPITPYKQAYLPFCSHPIVTRPSLGSRLLVKNCLSRIIGVVVTELTDPILSVRIRALRLLGHIIAHSEREIARYSSSIIEGLSGAFEGVDFQGISQNSRFSTSSSVPSSSGSGSETSMAGARYIRDGGKLFTSVDSMVNSATGSGSLQSSTTPSRPHVELSRYGLDKYHRERQMKLEEEKRMLRLSSSPCAPCVGVCGGVINDDDQRVGKEEKELMFEMRKTSALLFLSLPLSISLNHLSHLSCGRSCMASSVSVSEERKGCAFFMLSVLYDVWACVYECGGKRRDSAKEEDGGKLEDDEDKKEKGEKKGRRRKGENWRFYCT